MYRGQSSCIAVILKLAGTVMQLQLNSTVSRGGSRKGPSCTESTIPSSSHCHTTSTNSVVLMYTVAPASFEELREKIGDPKVKEICSTADKISDERYHQCQQKVKRICDQFEVYFNLTNQ